MLRARRDAGWTATQTQVLRSGRTVRKPHTARSGSGQGQIPDMIRIRDRPATTDEDGNWLPGHHEGDLILGVPSAVSRTLAGFRSRCTIPA